MFKSMYLNRETVIHRLDPRTKIICLLTLSGILFIFNDPRYVGAIAIGLLGVGALAQCLENYFRVRYLLLVSLLLPLLMWQFFIQGRTVIGHVGPIILTLEALRFGLAGGIRYASLLMVGVLFTSTMPVEEFQIGLTRLGVPYSIAFIFSLAVRLVPTFSSALTTIVEAQVGRGLDLETRNPVRLAKNLVPLFVPFLVCTIRYGSQLSIALESKGFSLNAKRTYLRELRMRARDYYVLMFLLVVTTAFLMLRLKGHGAILPG
jgi:energy-coupling factor transport system permease protein